MFGKKKVEELELKVKVLESRVKELEALHKTSESQIHGLNSKIKVLEKSLSKFLLDTQKLSKSEQNNIETKEERFDNSNEGKGFLRDFSPDENFYPNEDYGG